MNIVLLCGGLGTRLASVSKGKAKALIDICGKPFIHLLLDSLEKNSIKNVFLLISYGGKEIKNLIGDSYKGMKIKYIQDDHTLAKGTASALLNAVNKLPEFFIMQYGDTILDIDYKKFYDLSISQKDFLTMAIFKNKNQFDKSNVFYKNKKLIYVNSEDKHQEQLPCDHIDYGLLGLSQNFIEKYKSILKENSSLKNFQSKISIKNLIKPFLVNNQFYEIGTVESYKKFINSYKDGSLYHVIYS